MCDKLNDNKIALVYWPYYYYYDNKPYYESKFVENKNIEKFNGNSNNYIIIIIIIIIFIMIINHIMNLN